MRTAGKTAKDYQKEMKGQGFTFRQFEHMARADQYFDGVELWLSMWDYDNHESWHLWNWKQSDDEKIMMAMYEAEQFHQFAQYRNDFERFKEDWKAGEYDPGCTYTFPIAAVEVLAVVQEEEKNIDHEKVKREVRKAREAGLQKQRRERATKRKYRKNR